MKKLPIFALLPALALPLSVSHAQSCAVNSPKYKNTLVELYTSEGCSSCPPADGRLKEIVKSRPMGVIPLSLHITYWNDLGWTDAYSQERFDQRQYDYVRSTAASKFPYTPEFFVNGAEWKEWHSPSALAALASADAVTEAAYALKLSAAASATPRTWTITVSETETRPARQNARLFIALYEDGLSSDVVSGENRNHRLTHDHVVREWIGPIPVAPGTPLNYTRDLALAGEWDARKTGLVALVQDGDGRIAQAVSLPLCVQ